MSIAEFIREGVLRPRLKESGCLVVYDPGKLYREQCLDLRAEKVAVIETSESSIESREATFRALHQVSQANGSLNGVLVYVGAARPQTDEQKQVDPFSPFAECGAVFPRDDGDDYLSLCLRARPDRATEIRRVFSSTAGMPTFAVIDAIGGGGMSWPQLRASLEVQSSRELLLALLAPNAKQAVGLRSQDGWQQEARDFLRATLSLNVKTRGKSWDALADELWRYVLYSEFVFDLPGVLPNALKDVPRAPDEARPIVEDVCDHLRASERTRALYVSRADAVESELGLVAACADIDDLGERDTFSFEERTFLRSAIAGLARNDLDATRKILSRQAGSVWRGKGESQAQWDLVRAGLAVIETCDDLERQLPSNARTQLELIDFYLSSSREADRLQREFEQAAGALIDHSDLLADVTQQARGRYGRLAERVQSVFVKHLETAGWPPQGRLANADVFDRLIAERLKDSGHRVAYFMVDALRYELGVALEKQLAEDGPVELQAAYAQLPSITVVGMASLLPGARSGLALKVVNDTLTPTLGDAPVSTVAQRMGVLAKRYGDRFAEMPLSEFVRSKQKVSEAVHLLVLRSTEIDSQLENNPESTLGLIPATLKLIRVAIHKLRGLGFKEAVIVADHGFFLNAQAEAGDVCTKPQGKWTNAHDRMMLGNGVSDSHSVVMDAAKLGIRGDFAQVAVPRSMAPYRAGHLYFHGGASLAEAVVPVLVARLDAGGQPSTQKVSVSLEYRAGATRRITTRVPVIDVVLAQGDLLSGNAGVEILLEAHDAKGNVVGEAKPSGEVNPATRTFSLMPGEKKQIALRMDADFEGKFIVKALNPTTLASYCALNLETDYTV